VGTAEYIELDLDALQLAQAEYVTFTSNAYTSGALSPNLTLGWMSSQYPMHISGSGVAYDPSCVQHQVRVTQTLSKGLVFGVLDVAQREIIWLEMPFQGQMVQNLNLASVQTLLRKLESKLNIGQLLTKSWSWWRRRRLMRCTRWPGRKTQPPSRNCWLTKSRSTAAELLSGTTCMLSPCLLYAPNTERGGWLRARETSSSSRPVRRQKSCTVTSAPAGLPAA
jgi:hypothetical protein